LSSICDKKQHPSSPRTTTEHRFPSPHFFIGKLPTNATLKFDDTSLYICTSGSIVSEGRFAIEIYKCRLAKKKKPHKKEKLTTYYSIKTSNTQGWKLAGAQLPKAPKNLAGLLEIEVYFSYLDRIGLIKIVFV
jgi:hypothetical protein